MTRYLTYVIALPVLAIVIGCDDGLPDNVTADAAYSIELRERILGLSGHIYLTDHSRTERDIQTFTNRLESIPGILS